MISPVLMFQIWALATAVIATAVGIAVDRKDENRLLAVFWSVVVAIVMTLAGVFGIVHFLLSTIESTTPTHEVQR